MQKIVLFLLFVFFNSCATHNPRSPTFPPEPATLNSVKRFHIQLLLKQNELADELHLPLSCNWRRKITGSTFSNQHGGCAGEHTDTYAHIEQRGFHLEVK